MPLAAILNNVRWYRSVLAAHGIGGELHEHHWSTDRAVPPYYSNLVTRTRDGTGAQLERIRRLSDSPPAPRWSLKDSFAHLPSADLEALGLRKLFDARWYGLEVGAGRGSDPETDIRFVRVETPAELERWEDAWKLSSPSPGIRVFPPAMLDDPDVVFLTARRGPTAVGGAATNLSEGAVGVSNVFALGSEGAAPLLRDCARHVRALHPDRTVVGYGPESEARQLAGIGFRDLGLLRVWVAGPGRGP